MARDTVSFGIDVVDMAGAAYFDETLTLQYIIQGNLSAIGEHVRMVFGPDDDHSLWTSVNSRMCTLDLDARDWT